MDATATRRVVERELEKRNGLLRLRPAWVARSFLKPGRRLGLSEDQYDVGPRGFICERWLGSETDVDNEVKFPNEGLSFLEVEGQDVLLRDAVAAAPEALLGREYARTHRTLGRLAKIYDFESRIFYHYHQTQEDAQKVGRIAKEEAYFFPAGVEMGRHPETFFGVHPYLVEQGRHIETLLPYLERWDSDLILRHSFAYLNAPEDGFHLPAGLLHAPGTAVTVELQEPSDVMGVLQAVVDGLHVSKSLLLKDVPQDERERFGERAALNQLRWKENGDPRFYEHHHTPPVPIPVPDAGVTVQWIYYNTDRFSGKRLILAPGARTVNRERGVHNLLVWRGRGKADGLEIEGQAFGIDELLVPHSKAVEGVRYENTGREPLEILEFFGPDVNNEVVPRLA